MHIKTDELGKLALATQVNRIRVEGKPNRMKYEQIIICTPTLPTI